MDLTYPDVLTEVLQLMTSLADDCEYSGEITAETFLFEDLGFESLDFVVLGTAIRERFGRMPFAEFLAEIGQRERQDLAVGELIEFICRPRPQGVPGGTR